MTDIESLGFSLVFPVTTELVSLSPPDDDKTVKLRAYVRAPAMA